MKALGQFMTRNPDDMNPNNDEHNPARPEKVNTQFEKDVILIENTIGPDQDLIRITYRKGMTARDILLELEMANDYLLADIEGKLLRLEDFVLPSAELLLIPGTSAENGELNEFNRHKRQKLIDDIVNTFDLTRNQLSQILYKDRNSRRVHMLNDVLINNEELDLNRENLPNGILEFMYNIYMMDFMDPNVQEILTDLDLDTFKNKKIEVLELCREFLKDNGYDPDKVGFSSEEIINYNLYNKFKEIINTLAKITYLEMLKLWIQENSILII